MTGPATYVGMRRHRDVHGRDHLVGTFDVDVAIAAGAAVLLRRDEDGYVLQIVHPARQWTPTKRERTELAIANAPRGALRQQPNPKGDPETW